MAPASRAEGRGLSYDVSVATSKVPVFIDKGLKAVLEILPSIRPYPLGHIGDGNIHFSLHVRRSAWTARPCASTRRRSRAR